jgi:hypothetical protein
MKASDFTNSKYLAASDFGEKAVIWTIHDVGSVVIGRNDPAERPTLQLLDAEGVPEPRLLVLNVTNVKTLARVLGNDMDSWAGEKIRIWSEWTDFRGERVKGIRCAAAVAAVSSGGGGAGGGSGAVPLRAPARPAMPSQELDDEILF